jgi:hypothetical protein
MRAAMPVQQLVYRQLVYPVVIESVRTAIQGLRLCGAGVRSCNAATQSPRAATSG